MYHCTACRLSALEICYYHLNFYLEKCKISAITWYFQYAYRLIIIYSIADFEMILAGPILRFDDTGWASCQYWYR